MPIRKNISFTVLIFSLFLGACTTQKHIDVISGQTSSPNKTHSNRIFPDTNYSVSPTPETGHFEFVTFQTFYSMAFKELKAMLENKQQPSFKRAVYISENTYLENKLDYNEFCHIIASLAAIAKKWAAANPLKDYIFADSNDVHLNAALFYTLTDTIFDTQRNIVNLPYTYDFNDCFAKENWLNLFVTKLLITHKGNCHSLPFLYKILAEELNVNAWLSFTPNHIYLRNKCKKTGWYNTELTNASFPNEGWLMSSGYVSVKSIKSGIYMDTLGLKQSIVICLNDLAKGYLRKLFNPDLNFVLQCCDLGLKYYPNYAELLLLKAETHLQLFKYYEKTYGLNVQNENDPYFEIVHYHLQEMEKSYALLSHYDYREIPEGMFLEWINALENNKEKYQDKKISNIFKVK